MSLKKFSELFDNLDSINSANNKIIMSAHPSPYSANYGFFGSRPFSKANNLLVNTNQTKINW